MTSLRPQDLLHKSHLQRLLIEIIDDPLLSQYLAFKGGTCASMLGFLDRFSVDLDFDVVGSPSKLDLRKRFHSIFNQLGLTVVHELDQALLFQLRYQAPPNQRNILKLSAIDTQIRSNKYKVQYFPEIDRFVNSQTIETMFANKLVALTDRHHRYHTIAGRDIYDIHHFFIHGIKFDPEVIKERTGLKPKTYLKNLVVFIKKYLNQTIINEDLSSLLPEKQFQQIRKILIPETLTLLSSYLDNV